MDEYGSSLLLWIGALVAIGVFGYFALRYIRTMQRRADEYRAERQRFLDEFADTLSTQEIQNYKNIPNHATRIAWLKENHAEFIEKIPGSVVDFYTAKYLDVKLLRHESVWEEGELLQRYLERAENMSVNTYQEDLNTFALWIEKKAKEGFNREEESAKLWESLPAATRDQIKQERNPAERKKLLSSDASESASTYQSDYLYPIIMMSYLDTGSSDVGADVSYYDGSGDFGGGDSGGGDGGGGGD